MFRWRYFLWPDSRKWLGFMLRGLKKKSWCRQTRGHKLFWEVQKTGTYFNFTITAASHTFFPPFSAVLKVWGGVIWVRMSYLNTPLIRLQVLIDTPTLFLTWLKEQFGILAGIITFNVLWVLKITVIEKFISYSIRLLCLVERVTPLKKIFFPNLMCNAFISTATGAKFAYRCWVKTYGSGTSGGTAVSWTAARKT